jgi:integrase
MPDLSARQITALSAPGWHRIARNLYLRIGPGRSYVFRATHKGRQIWRGLGPAEIIPLATAKARALQMRIGLYEGNAPARRARGHSSAPTFAAMRDAYIKSHRAGWRDRKAAATWESSLATHAAKLSRRRVDEIDSTDIADGIRKVWIENPSTAKKVRGRIESILDYARAAGHRSGPNPAIWKGALSHLLPPLSTATAKHHSAIPVAEIPAFAAELAARDSTSAKALLFTLLCACRTGDTIGATWSEIDLDSKAWNMPAGRTKAGRPFRIPLSDHAAELLASLPRDGAFVFPSKRGGPLSNMAMLEMMRGIRGRGATVHGLRSSFRDWVSETGRPDDAAEIALDHAGRDAVRAAYARSDLWESRRVLMADWANFAMGTEPEKMIRIGQWRKDRR